MWRFDSRISRKPRPISLWVLLLSSVLLVVSLRPPVVLAQEQQQQQQQQEPQQQQPEEATSAGESTTISNLWESVSSGGERFYNRPFPWMGAFWVAGTDYRGNKVKVVDMHLHTGKWKNQPKSFQDGLLETIPPPFNVPVFAEPFTDILLSAYGIATQLFFSCISRGVLIAVYAPTTAGLTTNEFVLSQIRKLPHKFYGFASVPVDNWDNDSQEQLNMLRRFLALKDEFIGVKLAHPHMLINLNDARFYGIYGVAGEFSVPAFVHTGQAGDLFPDSFNNSEATHPDFLEEAIQLYPNTNFLIGHMGNGAIYEGLDDPFDASFRLAATYPNVYLEISALGSTGSDPDGTKMLYIVTTAKSMGLIERLIYGSDGPQFPGFPQQYLDRTKAAMEQAGYTYTEALMVLSRNFEKVFRVGQFAP